MVKYNAEEILLGIKVKNNKVLNYVYEEYFSNILSLIEGNNGDKHDAKDIFQEAIIIILRKINDENLKLSCNFQTYLYSVCQYLWLKELERRQKQEKKHNEEEEQKEQENFNFTEDISEVEIKEELFIKNEKNRLYQKHFKQLSKICQTILTMALDNIPFKDIAKKVSYKNVNTVKNRKLKCKKRLIKKIESDPLFKELSKQ